MIKVETGREEEGFISYIEKTISKLAKEAYDAFLGMFDNSRISRDGLILALKYLDEERSITKIDNPMEIKCEEQRIDIVQYIDGSGYHMDYDLTTDGELNDLTIQIEFLKHGTDYSVSLEDLRTL